MGAPLTAGKHRLSGHTSAPPLHALPQSLLWASEQPNNCSQHSSIHQKLPESPQACLCLCLFYDLALLWLGEKSC